MAKLPLQEYLNKQKKLNQKFIDTKHKILEFIPRLLEESVYKDFLRFFSKWNHYSSYNILLLYMQYPKAEYVAGFKRWQELAKIAGKSEYYQILRQDQRQNGIQLLIPFSLYNVNGGPRNRFLGYESVLVFDISQVNNITTSKSFSPYVPLKELDFDVFLFLIREPIKDNYLVLPGTKEDNMLCFQDAYVFQNMLIYNELAEHKREALLSSFIHIFLPSFMSSCSKPEQDFLYKSARCCLFHFYRFTNETFVFPELSFFREQAPEHILHLIHLLQLLVQKCIYAIHLGYMTFLKEFGDKESSDLLRKIEKEIAMEYFLE